MKLRLPLLLALLLFCLGATSCVHEYICQCDFTYSGQPGLPAPYTKEYTIKDTKSKAKSICEGNSSTSEKNGIKTVENCHLY